MSVLAKVIAAKIRKGEIEGLEEKIDVFYAAGKLTTEEYEYLMDLLHGGSGLHLTDTEAVAYQHTVQSSGEHGGVAHIGKDITKLIGGVFLAPGNENIGAPLGVKPVDLVEKLLQAGDVGLNGRANQNVRHGILLQIWVYRSDGKE